MPGIAVKALDSAGGAQIAGGQTFFNVENQLAVVLGDPVTPHGIAEHAGPHMATASNWFFLGGIGVCRAGDLASCGHPSTGRNWFFVE